MAKIHVKIICNMLKMADVKDGEGAIGSGSKLDCDGILQEMNLVENTIDFNRTELYSQKY